MLNPFALIYVTFDADKYQPCRLSADKVGQRYVLSSAAGKSSYFPGSYDCQLLKPHPPTLSNTMARSTMTIFLNIFLGASQPAKRRCGLLAAGLSRFALTKVCGRRGQKTCPRRLRSFGGFPRPILAALAAPRLAPLLWWLAPLFGRLAPPFRRFGVVLWPAPSEFCHNATKRLF